MKIRSNISAGQSDREYRLEKVGSDSKMALLEEHASSRYKVASRRSVERLGKTLILLAALSSIAIITGCGGESSSTSESRELGKSFVLDAPPESPVEISVAKEKAESADEVTLMGKVGIPTNDEWGKDKSPWGDNRATVFITDMVGVDEAHLSDPSHDEDECPFCKKKKKPFKEAIAMVQFKNDSGEVLELDVRDLFDLNDQSILTVTGKPKVNSLGFLVVEATGIHIQNRE